MDLNSVTFLKQATEEVPAVKYATGLVGIAAALFIIRGFFPDESLANTIPLLIYAIVAMTVLVIFAVIVKNASKSARLPALVFLWAVCIFVITFMAFTVSAMAIGQPTQWAKIILPKEAAQTSLVEAVTRSEEERLPDESATKQFGNLESATDRKNTIPNESQSTDVVTKTGRDSVQSGQDDRSIGPISRLILAAEKSQMAERLGIENKMSQAQRNAFGALALNVLGPLEEQYSKKIEVVSGVRSQELNLAIGGTSKNSHTTGEAIDIRIPGEKPHCGMLDFAKPVI